MLRPLPLLVLATLAATSCTSGKWQRERQVQADSKVLVELESWSGDEGELTGGFQHPVSVGATELAEALAALRHRPASGGRDPGPVIDPEFVAPLAQGISSALAGATDVERVRFAVANPDRRIFLPTHKLSRGVAFVLPTGELHLVFDWVDDPGGKEDFGSWANPVRRSLSDVDITPPPGFVHHVEDGEGRRRTWLQADLATWRDRQGDPVTTPRDHDPDPTPTKPRDPGTGPASPDSERAIKLRFLEQLYEEGLLAERAYRDKRRELEEDGEE